MKKAFIMIVCLSLACFLLTSCSANMSMPGLNGRDGDFPTDGMMDDGMDSFVGEEHSAGEYSADRNGRVASYNSDNDINH